MKGLTQLNKYPGVFYDSFYDGLSDCAYIAFSEKSDNTNSNDDLPF